MKITNKILMLALGALVFACEDPEYPTPVPSTKTSQAKVAGYNFWANSQNLDFLYDNAAVGQSNLAFGSNSGTTSALYVPVTTGLHNYGFDTTGKRTASNTQATFLVNKSYSIYYGPKTLSNTGVVSNGMTLLNDNIVPNATKATVRLINLSSAVGSDNKGDVVSLFYTGADTSLLSTYVTSKMPNKSGQDSTIYVKASGKRAIGAVSESFTVSNSVTKKQSTTTVNFESFLALNAGTPIEIRQLGQTTLLPEYPIVINYTFEAGKVYTVVLKGKRGSADFPLGYTVIQHN